MNTVEQGCPGEGFEESTAEEQREKFVISERDLVYPGCDSPQLLAVIRQRFFDRQPFISQQIDVPSNRLDV